MSKRLFSLGVATFVFLSSSAYAGPCDMIQLITNMKWAYDNNSSARNLIQQGVLEGGQAGVEKIKSGYRTGQSGQPGEPYKHLDSCGPIEILQAARNVTGT